MVSLPAVQKLMGSGPKLQAVAAALAKDTSAIVTLAGRTQTSFIVIFSAYFAYVGSIAALPVNMSCCVGSVTVLFVPIDCHPVRDVQQHLKRMTLLHLVSRIRSVASVSCERTFTGLCLTQHTYLHSATLLTSQRRCTLQTLESVDPKSYQESGMRATGRAMRAGSCNR